MYIEARKIETHIDKENNLYLEINKNNIVMNPIHDVYLLYISKDEISVCLSVCMSDHDSCMSDSCWHPKKLCLIIEQV